MRQAPLVGRAGGLGGRKKEKKRKEKKERNQIVFLSVEFHLLILNIKESCINVKQSIANDS